MSLTTVRQARKNHPLPLMKGVHSGPRKGTQGTNHTDVNVGSDLAPKKPATNVFQASHLSIPTKPPLSNEEPVRGEGPTRNTNARKSSKMGK